MMDYFTLSLNAEELRSISCLGLAHIGDGVYELMVRSWLCLHGKLTSRDLHRETVRYVCAPAQAAAAEKILALLTEEEAVIYRRGRNAHVHSVPRGANVGEYHSATGLEALFGWLYLQGRRDRLNVLFDAMMEGEVCR